jgi:cysteine desulfurase
MQRIYLEYAASTPTDPEVTNAMLPYLSKRFGNPSSSHSFGLEAREAVEKARSKVAAFIGARSDEIVFTSGGTESDNLAIKGIAFSSISQGNHIITTSIEHPAVIETCKYLKNQGFEVTYLPVDSYGLIDPDDLRKVLTTKTILVSIMHANNEVGTIEPISEISKITREAGIYFHTDAVQTVGHIPVNVNVLGVDLLSISAHKLYGPRGIGALYIRKGVEITPLLHGGGQEKKQRSGTENTASIVGFAKAVEINEKEMHAESIRLTNLRNRFTNGVLERISDIKLNGHPELRLPNNINISIDYIEGEATMLNLDLEGICVATGSACSSADHGPSYVLQAMDLRPEQAYGSLRITFGKWTTEAQVDHVIDVLSVVVAKLRAMSPLFTMGESKS